MALRIKKAVAVALLLCSLSALVVGTWWCVNDFLMKRIEVKVPEISRAKALEIALQDAQGAYHDLSDFEMSGRFSKMGGTLITCSAHYNLLAADRTT